VKRTLLVVTLLAATLLLIFLCDIHSASAKAFLAGVKVKDYARPQ
jgi:hypothetical protein